ncbi:MAG: hypothetical protein JSS07_05810 [Proteobacteria bacterium]|nr:hypothetical protein [Pseudomonadota bacterium]
MTQLIRMVNLMQVNESSFQRRYVGILNARACTSKQSMGYRKLYLLTFDETLPHWYAG